VSLVRYSRLYEF